MATAEFFVVLADQADLSAAELCARRLKKGVSCTMLYGTKARRAKTYPPMLREHGVEHRSFYIVNAILVKGTREMHRR